MTGEGTLIECTGLALTATEASSGLRCRIGATTHVPAQYDSERQAVTCMAPKVGLAHPLEHPLEHAWPRFKRVVGALGCTVA
jgi:hypothetical protein